ncbi:MAG: AAA family ATPase [Gemmataceae bacterium]|nr:AAA family ATPase [Gemmataceae bacterium]
MPDHPFNFIAVLRTLEAHVLLGEALFFPEVLGLGQSPGPLTQHLSGFVETILKQEGADAWSLRRGCIHAEADAIRLTLDPPHRSQMWRNPIDLRLHVVRWEQSNAFVAYIPALDVEVLAESAESLAERLPIEAKVALMRNQQLKLKRLTALARAQNLTISVVPIEIDQPTPKAAAIAEREAQERGKSVFEEAATNLMHIASASAFEIEEPLRLLAETLSAVQPRSVLLIGPSGVGKTAILHELVRRRHEFDVGGRPFWTTSGSRLVAGQSGFGMWQQRASRLINEAKRTRAIVHLGNLMEVLEVGKSEYQEQGLATFLRPWIARGDLLVVAECLPEHLPLIERQDPQLLRSFFSLRVEEPTGDRLGTILGKFAQSQGRAPLSREGLDETLRLHNRYATYSANPGRPIRFLRHLIADAKSNAPIGRPTITAAFSQETGLPLVLLDDAIPLDWETTRAWFASRVMGQDQAVDLAVSVLAAVKTTLHRPHRPIASLLFIGPTGVGKTEMAKAMAEFLFGSRDRLCRFDMSEFGDPLAVHRLIGGVGGEGLLTAKVREQPFSVILLDEVEKAHPLLFDLLLQVLGEGRLTDAAGRLADFRNAVVVMTSNLGAETYQRGAFGIAGRTDAARDAADHFREAVRKAVRPELFNRIDHIVPFAPLGPDAILRIARRELDLVAKRDGIRYRGVELRIDDDVAAWLAQRGYDARFGARPLKRSIEHDLLVPLADQLNGYAAETPLRAVATLSSAGLTVEVRARAGDAAAESGAAMRMAERCVALRRELQALTACGDVMEFTNETYRLKRKRDAQLDPHDSRILENQRLLNEVNTQLEHAVRREEGRLLALYEGAADSPSLSDAEMESATRQFEELLLRIYLRRFRSDRVSLALFSESPSLLFALAQEYAEIARKEADRVAAWQFSTGPKETLVRALVLQSSDLFGDADTIAVRVWDPKTSTFRDAEAPRTKGVVGLGFELRGGMTAPLFMPEEGLHTQAGIKTTEKALVLTHSGTMIDMPLNDRLVRRGAIGSQKPRRALLVRKAILMLQDALIGEHRSGFDSLREVLGECMRKGLAMAVREVLLS